MDVYEIITEKIINLLEQEIVPWRRPWTATGLPRNLVSKKPYRGVNYFLLSATKYVSPFWLSFRQANQLGGQVRKGEHGTIIVFWKVDDDRADDDRDQDETSETSAKDRRRFLLRYYRVWNVEQCQLPQAVLDKLPKIETHEHDPIEAAERIIAGMPNPPEIQYAGSKAFYSPITDRITLPPRELFTSCRGILRHADSRDSARNRPADRALIANQSRKPRRSARPCTASEELIAEMGAAFLCAEAGISPAVIENQAAYIQGWLRKLGDDRKLVIHAAAKAQKAADYVLNRNHDDV